MRRTLLCTSVLGAALLLGVQGHAADLVLAQASGTNLGTPQTQPMPGGGVNTGPGAATSALPGSTMVPGRGAPAPGSADPARSGDATSGSNVAPGGAIRPGSKPGGEGTGGNTGGSGGGG